MSLTQAVMSCLLIVSWVIEVEYTLTAIPQLQMTNITTQISNNNFKVKTMRVSLRISRTLHKNM